jgi:hypothetical protein
MDQAAPQPVAESPGEQAAFPAGGGTNVASQKVSVSWQGAPMTDQGFQHELNLRDQLTEQKTDTKIANVVGEIRESNATLRGDLLASLAGLTAELRGDYSALKAATAGKLTVILTGLSTFLAIGALVVALIIGMATSGQQMFGLGQATHDIATTAATQAATQVMRAQNK